MSKLDPVLFTSGPLSACKRPFHRWSAGICPRCNKSEGDLADRIPCMVLSREPGLGSGLLRASKEEQWLIVCYLSCWVVHNPWKVARSNSQSSRSALPNVLSVNVISLQLAEELQNKPLNSEIRELLKLLSKPNVKVRTCHFCNKHLQLGALSETSDGFCFEHQFSRKCIFKECTVF